MVRLLHILMIPRLLFACELTAYSEWVPLMYKGKYAGEVFLELTFYSAVGRAHFRLM